VAAEHSEIIVVRRRASTEDEHHGGAWKIAFADFMTAMMAFFLVLWIISATDKNTKTIIARYFNPVKVEEPAKGQKGIRGVPELDANSPGKEAGAAKKEEVNKEKSEPRTPPSGPSREAAEPDGQDETKPDRAPTIESKAPEAATPSPTMSERELFSDPRASLDKIAGPPASGPQLEASRAPNGLGEAGPAPDSAIRDPFRPFGSPKPEVLAHETNGAAAASDPAKTAEQPAPPASKPAEPKPAEAAHVGAKSAPGPLEAQRQAAARLLANVKEKLGAEADALPGPELEVQATDEGILVSLTDRQNFSMFAIGSAEPQPRVVRMMDAVAAALKTEPGAIVLRGHTDAHPYRSPTYDNWRLSSARAQMAYYMLNRAGIPEKRVERIEGFADHRLKDTAHPFAAENRRIEILLRQASP